MKNLITLTALLAAACISGVLTIKSAIKNVQGKVTILENSKGFSKNSLLRSIETECLPDNETITLSAQLVIETINAFKDNYTMASLGVPWEIAEAIYPDTDNDDLFICNGDDECFQVLPKIPTTPYDPPSSEEELERILIQVLGISQKYSVAFESLFLDEFLNENKFLPNMIAVKSYIEEVIDALMLSLHQCGLQPDQDVLKNLIEKCYVGGASSDFRAQRGFRTFRQTLVGLQYIMDMFPVDTLTQ